MPAYPPVFKPPPVADTPPMLEAPPVVEAPPTLEIVDVPGVSVATRGVAAATTGGQLFRAKRRACEPHTGAPLRGRASSRCSVLPAGNKPRAYAPIEWYSMLSC